MNNKLLFTLCRTCSENHQQTPCQHNDEERSLTGTCVTDELKKALEKGYVVQRIYEVWHFHGTEQYDPKTKTGGLFTDYVSDEMVEMRYQCKEEFVEESGRTNVVIAANTTAQARLKLYSYLEQLGPRTLYADTDSVVYTSRAS
jgi:hypothetical protein